jgi:hypothetical protein
VILAKRVRVAAANLCTISLHEDALHAEEGAAKLLAQTSTDARKLIASLELLRKDKPALGRYIDRCGDAAVTLQIQLTT